MTAFDLTHKSEVVCLAAHADDLEIGAAGLIKRLADQRPDMIFRFVILTGSDVRRAEAEASAAALLGERVVLSWGGLADGVLPYEQPALAKQLVREAGPVGFDGLVIAPRIDDAHQDHRFLGEVAWQVFRGATIVEYEIPKWETEAFSPNLFLPLSQDEVTAKLDHLEASFPSQHGKPWYRRRMFEGRLALRGIECGAESGYAEAFVARKLVVR